MAVLLRQLLEHSYDNIIHNNIIHNNIIHTNIISPILKLHVAVKEKCVWSRVSLQWMV